MDGAIHKFSAFCLHFSHLEAEARINLADGCRDHHANSRMTLQPIATAISAVPANSLINFCTNYCHITPGAAQEKE